MNVLSVNVGMPQEMEWRGRVLNTAIFKEPVSGSVRVGRLGLAGDAQADLTVHGGRDKAVYLYPLEHYPHWESVLGAALTPGALGENLTTSGLLESELSIGDQVEVGTALLQVAQPRLPCVKLGARHGRPDLPALFAREGRPGVYFRVLEEGVVGPGDGVRVVSRVRERWPVQRVAALLLGFEEDPPAETRLAGHPLLGDGARRIFQERTGFRGTLGEALPEEVEAVRAMLLGADLPDAGFPDHTPVILVARDPGGSVVGGVALELRGDAALLRSAVVGPASRGQGLGGALTRAAVETAWGMGMSSTSLLTETAPEFFHRFGFRRIRRGELPPALSASKELQGACPDSAVAMTLRAPPLSPGT